jgi:osmoprotectant transport system permease protein
MSDLLQFLANNRDYLWDLTQEHIGIVAATVVISSAIGIALGVICSRRHSLAPPVLAIASVLLTIPSFALLGFMALAFGYTNQATVAGLVLYSLLPITRNTYVGLTRVDPAVLESARGMGMSGTQVLTRIQLPIAAPVILAGIRQATVLNVAIATVGAAIASGGLGTPIFQGINQSNLNMVLGATIPVALLGITTDLVLGGFERVLRERYFARLRLRLTWSAA